MGLAVSSALMGNTLRSSLPAHLEYVAQSTFATPDLADFSVADRAAIELAYASASRAVFIFCTPVIGIAFLACAFVKDQGLQRKEEVVEEQKKLQERDGVVGQLGKVEGSGEVNAMELDEHAVYRDGEEGKSGGDGTPVTHELSQKPSVSSKLSERDDRRA